MDCSLPGACAPGIFQARVLKWIAISYARGSSWPRGWTPISYGLIHSLPLVPPGKTHSSFLSVNSYLHSISGMFMSVPISQFIPASLYPLGVHVFLLYVCISFCFVNKFICIIFLDSICKWYYMVCVFLFLTYFTLYESLWVHPCWLMKPENFRKVCSYNYFSQTHPPTPYSGSSFMFLLHLDNRVVMNLWKIFLWISVSESDFCTKRSFESSNYMSSSESLPGHGEFVGFSRSSHECECWFQCLI